MAEQGRLRTPAVLRQQLRRMLADPKSEALVTNFAGQWLYLRNLKNMVPLSTEFVNFDDNLRRAFEEETELFFESVMRENRSVLDLMNADYTFVNERLAKHYKIPGVYGSHFRRVTLADEARRGLLGKGAILMVTSHTDRTSPVVRGKWVLDNLLGAPPPPMPANVPPLDESTQQAGRVLTMRERMEVHRRNPVCANCHKIMDPIGLAMENFDAVGSWRTREGGTHGTDIDASGVLLDGTKVDGIVSLRQALMRNPETFVGTFAEKLMTYALGRGVSANDMPTVRRIVREAPARIIVCLDRRGRRIESGVSHASRAWRPKKYPSRRKECVMFISNRALSRRAILRGMGATMALPFLDAMVPVFRSAAAATPVRRFGAVFVPLGERPGFWDPTTVGANFEMNVDHEAAGGVPQPHDRCLPALRPARWSRDDRRGLAERRNPEADAGRERQQRCDGRSGHCRSDRTGNADEVARARDRGLHGVDRRL